MLKSIPKSNITNRSFKVYKDWAFDQGDFPTIIAFDQDGEFDSASFSSSNGVYADPAYHSTIHKYYTTDGNIFNTFGSTPNLGTLRNTRAYNSEITLLAVSQSVYGEGIKPGSLTLVDIDNQVTYTDDSYGGLNTSDYTYELILLDVSSSIIVLSDREAEYTGSIFSIDFSSGSAEIYFNTDTSSLFIANLDFDAGKISFDEQLFITGSGLIETVVCGNIFYSEGLVVVSDGATFSNYNLYYKSTQTIHELEVLLQADEGEFNYSQNPSATITELSGSYDFVTTAITNVRPAQTVKIKQIKDRKRREYYSGSVTSSVTNTFINGTWDNYFESASADPTGSYLTTYITTIGLYDENNNMVAVAKLPKPIKNLPDYPINFLVRIDL